MSYPRQSPTTHTEHLGDEASVYDWARGQVHALNPTAACVWRQCDGATSPEAIAAALHRDAGIPEAAAVVDLTLAQLARLHLLDVPASTSDRPTTTRRWLIARGVTAAMLPVIYSIVAPTPLEAQSPSPGAPTLASVAPTQGVQGTTVAVTLTGTNFVAGATVAVSGAGVTVNTIVVGSSTSLTANFVVDAAAAASVRNVTVATAGGTSGAQPFTVMLPAPGAPTLTSVVPNQGVQGSTVAVTLTGTNFVAGATVGVSGAGVTVNAIVVGSSTSLTANFVIDAGAATGARNVTVTTAGGTSGAQPFTVMLPAPGAPTLTSVVPNQGVQGSTVAVTLTGTNFVAGATVGVSGAGVTVNAIVVGSSTSLTANFVIDAGAATGARNVTVTTPGGTSGAQIFTINPPLPTLTSIAPNQGIRGTTVPVTLTGTNFVAGATVAIGGGNITVSAVVVVNSTTLTANFALDLVPAVAPRTVTVTTAGGTSGPQPFEIILPMPGNQAFGFTGGGQTFQVPAGVTSLTVTARGAQGGAGGNLPIPPTVPVSNGGQGGTVTAMLTVVPGETLNIFVGGQGGSADPTTGAGGFNGGGGTTVGICGGGGGGASDIRRGAARVLVAGGGGGGAARTDGGAGGGTTGVAGGTGPSGSPTGGGGGTPLAGGLGGSGVPLGANNADPGTSGIGGNGGGVESNFHGGGGGGGYYGGGGGGGGVTVTPVYTGSGGGGSSYADPLAATGVAHTQGNRPGNGEVTISW